MTLQQLEYFKVVAELNSFTKAANALYVAQSNLSHSIIRLENELNTQLVVRQNNALGLTENGKLLYDYVVRVFDVCGNMERRIKDMKNNASGDVYISITSSMADSLVPAIIKLKLQENALDGINLKFSVGDSITKPLDEVRYGKSELAFAHVYESGLNHREIACVKYMLAIPPEHPFSERESVSIKDLKDENIVFFKKNTAWSINKMFVQNKVTPKITKLVYTVDEALTCVYLGYGIALVPKCIACDANLIYKPIISKLNKSSIYISWNKADGLTRAAKEVLKFCLKHTDAFNKFIDEI